MPKKPTYEALKKRVYDLEQAISDREKTIADLKDVENELNRTREAFRQSKETARALLDASTESALLIDLDGTFVDMNEVTAKRLGKSVEELVGKSAFDFLPKEAAQSRKKMLDEILSTKKPVRAEDVRSDFILDNNLFPILDSEGNVDRIAIFSRDITKQKLAEKSLQESEYKYRSLFQHLNDAIFIHDLEGRIIDVNQKTEALFGYTKAEMLAIQVPLLHPVEAREKSKHAFETIIRDGSVDFEIEFKKKDGAVFLAEVSSSLFEIGGRQVVQGIARDITERRCVESELERMAQEWQSTFDSASDAIWLLDKDMRIRRANKISYQLFHGHGSELIGKHCWEIVHGTEQPIPDCPTMNATRSLCRETLELQMGENWFQVTVDPISSSSGEYDGAIHFLTDITERKKAEKALRESEARYRVLIETAPSVILHLSKDGRILGLNSEAEQLYGCSRSEVVGQNYLERFIPDEARTAVYEDIQNVLGGERTRGYENPVIDAHGAERILSWDVAPIIDDRNEATGIISVGQDITERKRTEDRTKKINRLNEELLISNSLTDKLTLITDNIIDIFGADFSRIWLIKPGDLCNSGCMHAALTEGPHACLNREKCLHLFASSGRYTHVDGGHSRVPFGGYKIGKIAAGEEPKFLTNDVTNDARIHDHEWARKIGLVSFAGYRFLSGEGEVIGVLALFSKKIISPEEDALLENIAATTAQVIQTATAEDALRDSELLYHDLYHNAPDMFVSVDAKTGNVLQCNNTLAEVLGYKKEEIIDRPVFDLYAPESVERAKTEVFQKFVETGEVKGEELQLQRKDGSVIDVSLNVSATHNEKGDILHSRSAWRDITKQKQAEKEKEKLIRELQEALKEIKTLRGILPLCSFCKKIRDDKGYWEQVDVYIHKHSLADISHSVCPECVKKYYPELDIS